MMTRAQLLAAADLCDAEAARFERDAAVQVLAMREQGRLLREAAEKALLTIAKQRSMVSSNVDLNLAGKPENVRTAANRTRRPLGEHDAKKLLLDANRVDKDIAKELGVGRSTVNAWFGGKRPIPREHAQVLLKKYAVPLSAWPRIA